MNQKLQQHGRYIALALVCGLSANAIAWVATKHYRKTIHPGEIVTIRCKMPEVDPVPTPQPSVDCERDVVVSPSFGSDC